MPAERSVLVVDDDGAVLDWLVEALSSRSYLVEGTTSPREALARVRDTAIDIVVADVEMPEMRGIELVRAMHAARPDQLIVLVTAFGTIELAMRCVRAGAADFVAKPFTLDALVEVLERTLHERTMRRQVVRVRPPSEPLGGADAGLVASSPAMKTVLERARRAGATGATVLLTGESGVGKSALARFIHSASSRRGGPLVTLNCAALPSALAEAELFGVKRGAFTDAREDRAGVFAQARAGTLFLDEIGEMGLDVQPKLLLALESGRFRPVGSERELEMDVRLVAATNLDLAEAVQARRFRADLYHRINVVPIDVPPLRARLSDMPELVDRTLGRLAVSLGRPHLGVSDAALRWLMAQRWPGNVRELSNAIERAATMSDHDVLLVEDFSMGVHAEAATEGEEALLGRLAAQGLDLAELERRYIALVLERCGGNRTHAARALGIDRTTLWRKLQT